MSTAIEEAVRIGHREEYREKEISKKNLLKLPDSVYPTDGILADVIEYGDEITEAPKEFLFASGLMLVSSVVQDRFYYVEGDQKIKLNMYMILVGSSSETKKTTAINICKRMILNHFEDKEQRFIFPSRSSPEAFFELIAGKAKGNDGNILPEQKKGLLSYSEFAELVTHLKKDYAGGLKELLTSGFDDCLPERILTKSTGEIVPQIDFINIFAASTSEWITHNLPEYDLRSGFLARFLMIYAEPTEKCYPFRKQANADLEDKIVECLKILRKQEPGEIVISKDARLLYVDWYAKDKKRMLNYEPDTVALFSRHRDYVKKLAALFQLAENCSEEIDVSNMKRAIEMIEVIRRQARYLVNEKLFINKNVELQNRLRELIGNKPGITKTEISRSNRSWDSKEVGDALGSLIEMDVIYPDRMNTSGRPTTIYFVRN